jgi:translation initiation factor IF-3
LKPILLLAHFTPANKGRRVLPAQKKHRTNDEIKEKEVRVIDANGEMLGILDPRKAVLMAEEAEMDLVEIAPKAKPPVCRIIDYGKFLYEIQKKEKLQRKNQQQSQMKEIRFKWRTADHDFNFKTRHAKDFIESGNKVKASVLFRGREITHQEIGRELLKKFVEEMKDVAKVDVPIKFEGRNLSVILAPIKSKKN